VSDGYFTDSGQTEAACRESMQDRFIHVHGIGWLKYNGKVWREVPDKVPLAHLRAWTARKLTAAANAKVPNPEAVKAWKKRLDTPKLKNVLTLAAGFDGISVDPEALDANPDVLNCQNGIVYLPTGDLIPHQPDLYLTKIAGCDYDPTALHEDWNAALQAIPPEVLPWLQTRYGQGITGHMADDDTVIVQQGGGANGKSTVLAGISAALGDYYLMASDKILMSGQMGAHTTDLADLRGSRFVAIEETPEAGRLDVVRLKKVAGTERITARKLYRDNYSFKATHTLFVNTNYPPVVGETDEGTWRRLALVVFPYTFTASPAADYERRGDPRLRDRLARGKDGQHRAVLAWLVEGAVRWYEAGRKHEPLPEVVAKDTNEWRGRVDHVATFWSDHLDPDPDSYVYAGDLIYAFNNYLRQHGNSPLAESTFVRRFSTHPITAGSIVTRTRVRQGPGLKLKQSRPYGSLDPFGRIPGAPSGQVWAWIGIRFRSDTPDPSDQGVFGSESRESR